MAKRSRGKKIALWATLLVAIVCVGVWIGLRLWRMGVAADVTKYTPADADIVLWVPELGQFTDAMVTFSRGVNQATRLRKLLESETGVDLGDEDGLRRVGVDPEAGMVVFIRDGMIHLLLGVEDAETFVAALRSKFVNLGYTSVTATEPNGEGVVTHVVGDKATESAYAAFAARDGLMVLVLRDQGADPRAGLKAVLGGVGQVGGFFDGAHFKAIEAELGKKGPLFYVNGDVFARDSEGKPRIGFLDQLKLPGLVDNIYVRPRFGDYFQRIEWLSARAEVGKCASSMNIALRVRDGVTLVPPSWLRPADESLPAVGSILPRETVLVARVAVNMAEITPILWALDKLLLGVRQTRKLFGSRAEDLPPLGAILGEFVHTDLADRHLVRDVAEHLTGHLAVAIVGIDRDAKLTDVIRPDDAEEWFSKVKVVLAAQLRDPDVFIEQLWKKKPVLKKLGFKAKQRDFARGRALRIERNCRPFRRPTTKKKQKVPRCERYGLAVIDDMLLITSGRGTVDRLLEVMDGKAKDLSSQTKEPLAKKVLESGALLTGVYFSVDGLLKALRDRNLPAGAKGYLAQMYELAITLNPTGTGASGRVLLTR